jgi:hypothetical protein
MKLIPDWKLAWRFLSVQAGVLLALLSGIQADVLPLITPLFPADKWPYVSGGLALAVVVLRLVAQDDLKAKRAEIALDRLEEQTGEIPLDQEMALPEPDPETYNPVPAGRLERYIGAVAGLVIAAVVLTVLGFAWSLSK